MHKSIKTLIKWIVSIVFLWIVSREINYSDLILVLNDINIAWLVSAFLVFVSIRFFMTLRWKIILNAYGVKIKFSEVLKIIFMSLPAGFITPGGVGMDLVRGYEISKKHTGYESAAGSILLDRIIGIASMFFVAMLAMFYVPDFQHSDTVKTVLILCNASIVVGAFGIIYLSKIISIEKFQKCNNKVQKLLLKIIGALSDTEKIKKIILPIITLSVLVQIIRCTLFYLIYVALGSNVSFVYFVAFVPMVFVLIFLPISLGGLGVREVSLMYFFSQVGVPGELSASAGIIAHAFHLLLLIPGLVMFMAINKNNEN